MKQFLFLIIITVIMVTPVFAQNLPPISTPIPQPSTTNAITMSNPTILGKWVMTNLTNNQNKEQKIAYIVQCEDANGVIGDIESTSATLLAGQKFSASQACRNDMKTAQIFILESLVNPVMLSEPLLIRSNDNIESPSQNYSSNSVMLSGNVNPSVVKNKMILLALGPSLNLVQIAQVDVANDGSFLTNIKTGGFGFTQSGIYVVKVYSDGILQKNLSFNYNATTGKAVAESTSTQNQPPLISTPTTSKIPSWVRHIFIYYGQGEVSEDELLGAIKFLVNQGIMKLS